MTNRRPALVLGFALTLAVAAPPAAAQTPEVAPPPSEGEPGTAVPEADALNEAARRALEDLLADLAPVLDALRQAVREIPLYGAPQILPNGDILIPRLDPDAPDEPPGPPDAEGERRLDL